jgi:IS30 family transposase
MQHLTQHQCNAIALQLNALPRKRLAFETPLKCFNETPSASQFKLEVTPL